MSAFKAFISLVFFITSVVFIAGFFIQPFSQGYETDISNQFILASVSYSMVFFAAIYPTLLLFNQIKK